MAALLAGSPAFAQTVDTAQPTDTTEPDATTPEAPAPAAPQAAPEDTTATIVVTGSRIRPPEFTSPDPVALIDPTMSKREGKLDTADMLQSSPIAAGSTQITSAISSNFVTDGGPGAQTINLRGLGANRTLVLLNGRGQAPPVPAAAFRRST